MSVGFAAGPTDKVLFAAAYRIESPSDSWGEILYGSNNGWNSSYVDLEAVSSIRSFSIARITSGRFVVAGWGGSSGMNLDMLSYNDDSGDLSLVGHGIQLPGGGGAPITKTKAFTIALDQIVTPGVIDNLNIELLSWHFEPSGDITIQGSTLLVDETNNNQLGAERGNGSVHHEKGRARLFCTCTQRGGTLVITSYGVTTAGDFIKLDEKRILNDIKLVDITRLSAYNVFITAGVDTDNFVHVTAWELNKFTGKLVQGQTRKMGPSDEWGNPDEIDKLRVIRFSSSRFVLITQKINTSGKWIECKLGTVFFTEPSFISSGVSTIAIGNEPNATFLDAAPLSSNMFVVLKRTPYYEYFFGMVSESGHMGIDPTTFPATFPGGKPTTTNDGAIMGLWPGG